MVFGIFSILGYRFAPRIADLGDQRFWRADVPGSDTPSGYGTLEAIARNKINREKIHTQCSLDLAEDRLGGLLAQRV